MNTYMIHFRGRRINSIGRPELFGIRVFAETLEKAILKLYDNYDHISVISVDNISLAEWACS